MTRSTWGSIRELPSKRFQVRATVGGRPTSLGSFSTAEAAEIYLEQMRLDMRRGLPMAEPVEVPTLAVWAKRVLPLHTSGRAASTAAGYESLWRVHIEPTFGPRPLTSITPTEVRAWQMDLPLSPSRKGQALLVLRWLFQAAVDDGILDRDPTVRIKRSTSVEREPHIVTPGQVLTIANSIAPPLRCLVLVLGFCGLRLGEALELRRTDLDLAAATLTVARSTSEVGGRHVKDTKTHQERVIGLPAPLVTELRAHLLAHAGPQLLFPGTRGHLSGTAVRNAWATALTKARETDPTIPADLIRHDLRASCASWVAPRHGMQAAGARLGHADITVTSRHYARPEAGSDLAVSQDLARMWHEARPTKARRHRKPAAGQ